MPAGDGYALPGIIDASSHLGMTVYRIYKEGVTAYADIAPTIPERAGYTAEWKYTAYRFRPDFGILNDVDGKDMSVSDIYADEGDTSEEVSSHVVDIF